MVNVLGSFVSLILLVTSLSAEPWHVDSIKIGAATQDSTGQIWGFGVHPNLGVYRWQSERWLPISVAGVPNGIWPWTLALGPDGAVYLLWSDGVGSLAVSRHQGTDSKLLVRFAGAPESVTAFRGRHDSSIITNSDRAHVVTRGVNAFLEFR